MSFGRLERGGQAAPISEINVTPLVDVLLVLVVILLVTAPLLASALRLDLPQATGTRPADAPRFLAVSVDAQGLLFLNDRPTSPAELVERLAQAARDNPDTELRLRADQAVPYGRVAEVLGVAQQAGLSRIAFVAEPAKP
jgi:biopolymer transport protein TolR